MGVCGLHGAIVLQPQIGADVLSDGSGGAELLFAFAPATVRAEGGDLGPGGVCVDQNVGVFSGIAFHYGARGSVRGIPEGSFSSSHCAGPLPQELALVVIHGHRSRARFPTFDFRGSFPFVAGPFSGTLESTLELKPASGSAGGFGSFVGSSIGSSYSSSPARKVLYEQVELRYRVSAAPANLGASFAGERGPFCLAFDVCGARGSLTLAFPRLRSTLDLYAFRTVKVRVGRRQALRDFRAGRLSITPGGPVGWVVPRLSETFSDGGTCTDSVAVRDLQLELGAFGESSRKGLPLAVTDFNSDPWRTHCPGPESQDILGGAGHTLVRASISRRRLLQRTSTITLRTGGAFGAPGFVGSRSGQITLSLSLLKVMAGTVPGEA
jgi:hypothetical protein